MFSSDLKPHYDYDVKDAYSKLNPLVDRFILFKDKDSKSHPYISGKLKEVKIVQIHNTDTYAINVVLGPPLMKFKSKPTPDKIRTIVRLYEEKSEEERKKITELDDEFIAAICQLYMKGQQFKKIPRWKFLERRRTKEELEDYVLKTHKKLRERFKEYKKREETPILISYNPLDAIRICFKESIDTLEVV